MEDALYNCILSHVNSEIFVDAVFFDMAVPDSNVSQMTNFSSRECFMTSCYQNIVLGLQRFCFSKSHVYNFFKICYLMCTATLSHKLNIFVNSVIT